MMKHDEFFLGDCCRLVDKYDELNAKLFLIKRLGDVLIAGMRASYPKTSKNYCFIGFSLQNNALHIGGRGYHSDLNVS